MAEKQEHSSARDFHSCSSKLVCPLSLVSLLICTAALVRVEIINQRVHDVEDLVADARQNQNVIKVFSDATSFKRPERVEPDVEFDHKINRERRDETKGIGFFVLDIYAGTLGNCCGSSFCSSILSFGICHLGNVEPLFKSLSSRFRHKVKLQVPIYSLDSYG